MIRRPLRSLLAALVVGSAVVLGGCSTPAPAPTPSPTGFTDEAEAFTAAEETYRAYVDALNQVDLADPATFEDVYAWTTGDANATDKKSFSSYHAEGFTVTGETVTESFTPVSYDSASGTIVATVCSDISQIEVTNASGESQVAEDRPDLYELEVTFVRLKTAKYSLAIQDSAALELSTCAV